MLTRLRQVSQELLHRLQLQTMAVTVCYKQRESSIQRVQFGKLKQPSDSLMLVTNPLMKREAFVKMFAIIIGQPSVAMLMNAFNVAAWIAGLSVKNTMIEVMIASSGAHGIGT